MHPSTAIPVSSLLSLSSPLLSSPLLSCPLSETLLNAGSAARQREWRSTTPLSPSLIHNNCVRRPPLANHMWVRRSGSVLSAMKIRPLLPILLRLFFPRRDTTWYQLQPLQQKDILLSGAIVFDTLRAFFRSFGVRKVGSKERGEREERKIRPHTPWWSARSGMMASTQNHNITN